MIQVLTTVVGRYKFRQLLQFNPGCEPDPNDELGKLNSKKIPKWNPPLTRYRLKKASKDSIRRGHILAAPIHAKRFCWKLSDTQVMLMFQFFSSAKAIQNVAYGTLKGKDHLGNPMVRVTLSIFIVILAVKPSFISPSELVI